MLIPESNEGVNTKPQMPSNVLSISQLKSMNINDQVLALLKNGKYRNSLSTLNSKKKCP